MSGPPAIEEVGDRLQAWARSRLGDDAEVVSGPDRVTGGLDTFIYRFGVDGPTGRPLILRLYPSVSRGSSADKEARVLGFLATVGYPAPRVLAHGADTVDFGLPYVVMEQVPGSTVLDRVKARPHRSGDLLDSLAAAQASLHGVDPSGWPDPAPVDSEIDRRLAGVGGVVPDDPALARSLRWLQANRGVAQGEEPVVCHNDFHPLNALIDDDGRLAVIDWEGSGLGDRHSDLARTMVLFEWGPAVATSTVERLALRAVKGWLVKRYRAAYERHLPVDGVRLHYWLAFHAAESWWEAASLLDGSFARDTRTDERAGPAAMVAPAMAALFARLVPDA